MSPLSITSTAATQVIGRSAPALPCVQQRGFSNPITILDPQHPQAEKLLDALLRYGNDVRSHSLVHPVGVFIEGYSLHVYQHSAEKHGWYHWGALTIGAHLEPVRDEATLLDLAAISVQLYLDALAAVTTLHTQLDPGSKHWGPNFSGFVQRDLNTFDHITLKYHPGEIHLRPNPADKFKTVREYIAPGFSVKIAKDDWDPGIRGEVTISEVEHLAKSCRSPQALRDQLLALLTPEAQALEA